MQFVVVVFDTELYRKMNRISSNGWFFSQPYFTVSFLLSFTFCCLHLFGFISIHVGRYIEIDPGWSSHLMVIHVNIRVHFLLARPPRTTSSMLKCLYICLKYFCILNDDASNFLLFRRYFSVCSARLFMLLLLLLLVCVSAWHTIPFIRLVCLFA